MARLQGLTSLEARRFRTGRPSLDFAHTGGEGAYTQFELLHRTADVSKWIGVVLDVGPVDARPGDLARALELRRAVWNSAQRVVSGRHPSTGARRLVNRYAAAAPAVPLLATDGSATVERPVSADQALSTLARDAIDLFGGPLGQRVRICAADDCGLLFVDQSRPGARRWCSMQRCGTIAKVRGYRARVV